MTLWFEELARRRRWSSSSTGRWTDRRGCSSSPGASTRRRACCATTGAATAVRRHTRARSAMGEQVADLAGLLHGRRGRGVRPLVRRKRRPRARRSASRAGARGRRLRVAAVVARLVARHDRRRRRARHPRRPGRSRRTLHAPADRRRAVAPAPRVDPPRPAGRRRGDGGRAGRPAVARAVGSVARAGPGRGDPRDTRRSAPRRVARATWARCCPTAASSTSIGARHFGPNTHPDAVAAEVLAAHDPSGDDTVTSWPKKPAGGVVDVAGRERADDLIGARLHVRPLPPHDSAEGGEDGEREQLGHQRLGQPGEHDAASSLDTSAWQQANTIAITTAPATTASEMSRTASNSNPSTAGDRTGRARSMRVPCW